MNILKVPIEKVAPWEKNPRGIKKADYERLKKQIKELGVYKPLVCFQEGEKYVVLGGNMRIRALKDLGYQEVDVSLVEAETEALRIKYALSDNDRAGYYEDEKLAELIYPHMGEIDLKDFKVDLGEAVDLGSVIDGFGPTDESQSEPSATSIKVELEIPTRTWLTNRQAIIDGLMPILSEWGIVAKWDL